tara:strand:+ start:4389 stop:5456 length:1068 start_codon:yes stop_codon:yes gene_type:complete
MINLNLSYRDFQDSIIKSNISVREAMKKIGMSKIHILMIVDGNNKLVATVTDGDIRRSLLNGYSLDTKINKIGNLNPKYVKENTKKTDIIKLMKKEQISQIPILDKFNRIINIAIDTSSINNIDIINNKLLILAGGKGVRLRPITLNTPKPLIQIGNDPIIGTMIKNFSEQGIVNFIISLNYQKDKFVKYFKENFNNLKINFIYESKNLGTAGPLFKIKKIDEPLIVVNGDLLCKFNVRNMLTFHHKNNADITVGIKKIEDHIPYGVIRNRKKKFQNIDEKPKKIFNIAAGIYILSNKLNFSFLKNNKFDMPDLLNKFAKKKLNICVYPIEEYWIDIGNTNELERAKLEFSDEFN